MADALRFAVDDFPSDSALEKLWLAAWREAPSPHLRESLKACLLHVTAWKSGELVGFVKAAGDGGVHAFLLDPTVHPDYRRKGLGRSLVARAAALAKQRGAYWLHVDFEPHLRGFYEGCGFSPTQAGLLRLGDEVL